MIRLIKHMLYFVCLYKRWAGLLIVEWKKMNLRLLLRITWH